MGIMDMFQGAGSGLLNAITPTKKPGEFCVAECNINDIRCGACLAEQEKIRAAVEELQNLEFAFEDAANAPRAADEHRITKCSLCGAPVEQAEQSCPYCGEPYPARAVTADIPTSKVEQDNMLLQKASEIYDMYAALKKRVNENKGSDMKGNLPGFLGGAATALYATTNKFVDMTSQEIRKLARQNGVSYCDYVVGVMQGVYQSAGDIRLQQLGELSEQRRNISMEYSAKQRQENQRYRAEQRQFEQERRERERENLMNSNKRLMEMTSRPAPKYSGGGGGGLSSKCCGTCRHFIAADTRCAIRSSNHWQPSSANDDCNQYVPK